MNKPHGRAGYFRRAQGLFLHVWDVEKLWSQADGLPVVHRPLSDFDLNHLIWPRFSAGMTIDRFIRHARQCGRVECSYPIILDSDGLIMDGMHRLAALGIKGSETIPTVQFTNTPAPDYVLNSMAIAATRSHREGRGSPPGNTPRLKRSAM